MMNKPRYWNVAYPLVVTCLCVAPQDYFLRHWIACFEVGLPKLKVRNMQVGMRLTAHCAFIGKAIQIVCHEWNDATHLDLFIPLS